MTRALAAAGARGLLLGALIVVPGCRERPLELAYDLAARAPVAEHWSAAEVILFGAREADARLAGLDEQPASGPDGAYRAASREVRARLDWDAVRPRVAILDAAPWAGLEAQSVELFLNEQRLERQPMGAERRRYLVPLPSRAQRSGENVLRFVFSEAAKEGSHGRAAALYSLVIGSDADSSLLDLVERGAPSPFASVREGGVPGFDLVGPASLRFALLLPPSAELRFTPALHPLARRAAGSATFRVLLEREGGEERELWKQVVGAATPDPGEQVVRLEGAPGDAVRLTLAVEAAGGPRFAWGRFKAPRVLGRGSADPLRRAPLSVKDMARATSVRRGLARLGANVVLVVLDAARAREFGVYGYDRDTTPQIDRIASEGVVFERAYTPAVFTLAAMSSVWMSRYPDEIHPTSPFKSGLPPDQPSLAEVLSGPQIRTAGFVANGMAGKAYGLDRGFDEFFEVFKDLGTNADAFLKVVPPWIATHRDERFFAYVHFREPHFPYDPPPPWDTRFGPEGPIPVEARRDWEVFRRYNQGSAPFGPSELAHLVSLYDGNLGFVDHVVGALREALVAEGLWDRTVFIVTADHGEALHERGFTGHNVEVYETSAHIPLVVRLPPSAGVEPRRVSGLVSLLDVAPTIADVFGRLPTDRSSLSFRGRSLLPVIEGAAGRPAVLTRTVWESPRYALRDESYTYVLDTRSREALLFDRLADPDESRDLAAEKPVRAAAYRESIEAFLLEGEESHGGAAGEARLSREQCENLRTLGYVEECP